METLKAAEGRRDVDREVLEVLDDQPAPGDVDIVSPTTASGPTFGIPEVDDPDPFGVLALEKIGLEIKEAGTKSRPPSSMFEYNPSPTSPIFGRFQHRRSMDTLATNSNRESYMSTRSSRTRTSTDRWTQTTEMGTQTDFDTPGTSPNRSDHNKRIEEEDEAPAVVKEPEEIDYTKIDLGPYSSLNHSQDFDGTTVNGNESPGEQDTNEPKEPNEPPISVDTSFVSGDEDDDLDDDEEPVIFEAASAQATIITPTAIKARGGLVNIPKRPPPPPLPPRNIARSSRNLTIDQGSGRSPMNSPLKSEFEEVDLHGSNRLSADNSSNRLSVGNASNRLSVDSTSNRVRTPSPEKEPVLEDLEKTETAKATAGETLEDKVEEALEEQHIDHFTPAAENVPEYKHFVTEFEESEPAKETPKIPGSLDDSDYFQSLPTTPEVEYK